MQLSDMQSRFQLMAADDGTYWSTTEITTWLNDGQRDFAARTLSVRSTASFNTTSGTAVYDLGSVLTNVNVIRILRVTNGNAALYRENEFRLDRLSPGWMATNGSPTAYLHGLEGAKKVRLYPNPNAVVAINVTVAQTPPDLVNTTDVSIIPIEYHHALVLYALCKAFLKDGDQFNPQKAQGFWEQYQDQVTVATDYVAHALNRGQMSGFDGTPRDAAPSPSPDAFRIRG